ncbi:hypothetical protein PVAP13_6KG079200 [Panicum virgatum]|uniref:Uncharacterized protein n=1 Tax=Panicum virgatum TaxID=38727 RepID=A0A8T0RAI9_PANVG|nr:hypothetical protein PVAP13_6KG079200 [Panicum virgatum]
MGAWISPVWGSLSWVMLDVAHVDFFWVAGSVGGASFVLFQGQDDDGRCAPEGGCLVAKMLEVSSGTLVGLLSCRSCFFTDSGGTRGGAMCRRCVHEDPGSVKSNLTFVRVLSVSLHSWRKCPEVLVVFCNFSRVLPVRAWFS